MNDRDLALEDALELVLALIAPDTRWADASKAKLELHLSALVRGSQRRGATHLSDLNDAAYFVQFINEPVMEAGGWREPSDGRLKSREWAVGVWCDLLLDLGFACVHPRLGRTVSAAITMSARPLVDAEMKRVRSCSCRRLLWDRGPATVALAETGANDAEVASVKVRDADLVRGVVTVGIDHYARRELNLTEWGIDALRARVEMLASADHPIVVMPKTVGASATASVSGELRKILDDAGLRDPRVKPKSIRGWAGLKAWEATGNPIAVARVLGTGLQAAMDAIGVDWRDERHHG